MVALVERRGATGLGGVVELLCQGLKERLPGIGGAFGGRLQLTGNLRGQLLELGAVGLREILQVGE